MLEHVPIVHLDEAEEDTGSEPSHILHTYASDRMLFMLFMQ